MKVSVVLVVHERYLQYLPTALESLKRQKDSETEIIVIANGCDYEDESVSVVRCDTTLAGACNRGIRESVGDFILRIDSDDWVEWGIIEQERKYLEENPEVDAVWCDYVRAHPKVEREGFQVFELEHDPQERLEHACGVMFKKSCWEKLGGYNEKLEYQESFDFWIRFKRRFRVSRLALPLYVYRKTSSSMSTQPGRSETRTRLIQELDVKPEEL